jgi:AcrR family transcriptional regulator
MAAKRRTRRVSLSPELILDAAFRVVDDESANELTMSRLGRELDADPSAVYRHFRNKDELLLAMADMMLEEALDGYVASDDPVENLRRLMWSLRRSYLRRPGLARFVTFRFTGGEAEAAVMRANMGNLAELGYDKDQCVALGRALEEMTFGQISHTADVLTLPTKILLKEMPLARAYFVDEVKPAKMSDVALREWVIEDANSVFHNMLETYLASLKGTAPKGRRPSRSKTVKG